MAKFTLDTSVKTNTARLATISHRAAVEKLLDTPVEALCRPDDLLVKGNGFHAFFEAVHHAFANHYGLRLKPDNFFVVVNQGFAQHINANAEKYRDKFVQHEGKETIAIYRPDFVVGNPDNDWPAAFGDFSDALRKALGDKNHGRFTAEFSTSGPVSKVVSQIVLMDIVQSYFSYEVFTDCGIPFIDLQGTTADWKKLRDHVASLKEFGDLEWWIDSILPIFDELVNASEGNVNKAFWMDIYKHFSMSGTSAISGWVAKLLPYTKERWSGKFVKNGMLAGGDRKNIDTSELPSGVSNVPFTFDGADYQFIGGHTGVLQDPDGAVRPAFGWAVRPTPEKPATPDRDGDVLETIHGG